MTAQVTVRTEDGKAYEIAFADGIVIAATSPLPNDSVTRVALTSHFVSPTQVGEITRRLAAEKDRDEVDVVADAARLSAEHVATLRRRLTLQRAARTFAIDRGEFEIEDAVTLPRMHEVTIPLGAVVFHGVRMNLSEQRLAEDLRELGSSFLLKSTTTEADLAQFEFESDVSAILEDLRAGITLAELEAKHRAVEPRTLHAMLYALVCGTVCDASGGQKVDRKAPPAPRTSTGPVTQMTQKIHVDQPLVARAKTTSPPTNVPRTLSRPQAPVPSRTISGFPPRQTTPLRQTTPPLNARTVSRTQTPSSSPLDEFMREVKTDDFKREIGSQRGRNDDFKQETPSGRGSLIPRTITAPRTITERDRARREIEELIATRLGKLAQGADHFVMLGCPFEAPPEAVRAAYIETSRKLHPESLEQVGILDENKAAERVLAQVNAAFQALSDPQKRREYINAVRRGEATPIAPRARTGELDSGELAAEAFQKGDTALKRDDVQVAVEELGRAVTLAPTNLEYAWLFAWAQFCAASDKMAVYSETRKQLLHAINRLENPTPPRFYLGRVERMLGHDREAMNHFELVLLEDPSNREAQSEVRVLQTKLAKGTKPKR